MGVERQPKKYNQLEDSQQGVGGYEISCFHLSQSAAVSSLRCPWV